MLRVCFALATIASVMSLWGPTAASQSKPEVQIVFSAEIVPQTDAPITVVGLRRPSKKAGPATVVFRNDSSKQVQRVTFESGLANARALRAGNAEWGKDLNFVGGTPSEPLNVKPGALGEYKKSPRSANYVSRAAKLQVNCLRLAYFVMKVEFADGTEWEQAPESHVQAWLAAPKGTPLPCESTPEVPGAMLNLAGAKFRMAGEPSGASQKLVTRYQYECSLRPGDEFAMCPF